MKHFILTLVGTLSYFYVVDALVAGLADEDEPASAKCYVDVVH